MPDYLSRFGAVPFSHSPVNDVDLLIFAQLAYMDFEAVDKAPCPFTYALAHASFADSPDPSEDRFSFQKKDDLQLASLAASCPRYQDILFAGFTRHFDPQAETQFAALSLLLDEENLLIAFRGKTGALLGSSLMGLMEKLPPEAREQLIEAVYDIIASSEADTFNGMAARWLQSAAAITGRLFRTDAETRRLFLTAITAFLSSAAHSLDALIRE